MATSRYHSPCHISSHFIYKFVFDEVADRAKTHDYKVFVSNLEIYNEQVYDLLDKDHVDQPIEEWNKV